MPGKPTSGNRTARRGKPTRVRRRLSKEAARRLDAELAWATEDAQDEILSTVILLTPVHIFRAAADAMREMRPETDDKPIII